MKTGVATVPMLAAGMEGLENVLHALTRGARSCLEDGCQLETADDDTAFVVAQGGLMTALRLGGLRHRLDDAAFERLVAEASVALTPALVRPAHSLQVVLERDPDRTGRELERRFAPVRRAACRLGLALDGILDDTQARLAATCASERAWLAVWTHPAALTRPERRQARTQYFRAMAKRTPAHPPLDGQNVGVLVRPLRETHAAVVATLTRDLDACRPVSPAPGWPRLPARTADRAGTAHHGRLAGGAAGRSAPPAGLGAKAGSVRTLVSAPRPPALRDRLRDTGAGRHRQGGGTLAGQRLPGTGAARPARVRGAVFPAGPDLALAHRLSTGWRFRTLGACDASWPISGPLPASTTAASAKPSPNWKRSSARNPRRGCGPAPPPGGRTKPRRGRGWPGCGRRWKPGGRNSGGSSAAIRPWPFSRPCPASPWT